VVTLPVTGSNTTVLVIAGGVLIVVGAVFVAALGRRRSER
jgi:LPXTG-motif cell wall-anchored protein